MDDINQPPENPDDSVRINNAVRYLKKVRNSMEQVVRTETPGLLNSHAIAAAVSPQIDADCELPEQFGRFGIVRVIGQGGFARVFLARDPHLERNIALKVPRFLSSSSSDSRARFRREAKAAAILSHPNIVPVFETGQIGPIEYIASAFVDGQTLSQWLEQTNEPIDIRSAAEIVATLAEAVEHAHQRGVIHRDLKPGNILIEKSLGKKPCQLSSSRLRITDFGLAKFETIDQFETLDGAILGTPVYMSPEQARGELKITRSTDIYSLGVMLYELLTGKLPHSGSSHAETLHKIGSQNVTKPRTIRASISRDLEAICLKAVEPDVADRYDSAFDLAADLNNWLDGKPIAARPVSAMGALVKRARKNPAISVATTALFASLILGMTLTYWQYQKSQSNLAASLIHQTRATNHLERLQSTVDFIIAEYDPTIEPEKQLDESDKRVLNRMLKVHLELIDQESDYLTVNQSLIGNYLRVARILDLLGEYQDAIQHTQTAIDLLDSVSAEDLEFPDLSNQKYIAAFQAFRIAYRNGSADQVDANLDQLSVFLDDASLSRTERLTRGYAYFRHRGLAEQMKQKFSAAEASFLNAYEKIHSLKKMDPANVGWRSMELRSMLDVANVTWALKRREQAIQYYEQLIILFENLPNAQKLLPNNLFVVADCRSDLGHALSRKGRRDEAFEQYESALEIYRTIKKTGPGKNGLGRQVHLLIRIADNCIFNERYERGIEACNDGLLLVDEIPKGRFQIKTKIGLLARRGRLVVLGGGNKRSAEADYSESLRLGGLAINNFPADGSMYASLGRAHFYMAEQLQDHGAVRDAIRHFNLALDNFEECHRRQNLRSSPRQMAITATIAKSDLGWAESTGIELVDHWERLIRLRPDAPVFYLAAFDYLTRKFTHPVQSNATKEEILRARALEYLELATKHGFDNPEIFDQNVHQTWKQYPQFRQTLNRIGYDK